MQKRRVKIRDIVSSLEKWAPSSFAEEWDNPGLLTGNQEQEIDSVLISLNATEDALKAAKEIKAQLLITHHPLIFQPLKKITSVTRNINIIYAVKNNISVYSSHTNLDIVKGGVNFALAEKIGLKSVSFLKNSGNKYYKFVTYVPENFVDKTIKTASDSGAGVIGNYSNCSFSVSGTGTYKPLAGSMPYKGEKGVLSKGKEVKIEMLVYENIIDEVINSVRAVHPYEEMAYDVITLHNKDDYSGYGAIGTLPKPMSKNEFLLHVLKELNVETVKYSICDKKLIKKVAVMGGAGGKYAELAIEKGADAFITGEAGYHDSLDYGENILFIEASHDGTENPVLENIKNYLENYFGNKILFNVYKSKNIMNYFYMK